MPDVRILLSELILDYYDVALHDKAVYKTSQYSQFSISISFFLSFKLVEISRQSVKHHTYPECMIMEYALKHEFHVISNSRECLMVNHHSYCYHLSPKVFYHDNVLFSIHLNKIQQKRKYYPEV